MGQRANPDPVHGPQQWVAALDKLAEEILRFVDDRPFVGGIDTSHSLLYFAQYGPALVPPAMRDQPVAALLWIRSITGPR